jgi:hypothetical protein
MRRICHRCLQEPCFRHGTHPIQWWDASGVGLVLQRLCNGDLSIKYGFNEKTWRYNGDLLKHIFIFRWVPTKNGRIEGDCDYVLLYLLWWPPINSSGFWQFVWFRIMKQNSGTQFWSQYWEIANGLLLPNLGVNYFSAVSTETAHGIGRSRRLLNASGWK